MNKTEKWINETIEEVDEIIKGYPHLFEEWTFRNKWKLSAKI